MSADEAAELRQIEIVYRKSAGTLRRVAAAIIGDRDTALDAVQRGFARAVQRRSSFRGDGSLEARVWRIVVNEARDARARLLALQLVEIGEEAAEHELPVGAAAAGDLIMPALAELPERQRLVVFLYYFADLDDLAIAELLSIREETVGITLDRAHARLRERLEEVAS